MYFLSQAEYKLSLSSSRNIDERPRIKIIGDRSRICDREYIYCLECIDIDSLVVYRIVLPYRHLITCQIPDKASGIRVLGVIASWQIV